MHTRTTSPARAGRLHAVALLVAAVALGATGCGDAEEPVAVDAPSPPATSPTTVGTGDRELAAALVAFARSPGADTLAVVPLAPEVALGLADRLEPAQDRSRLARPGAWSIEAPDGFRGRVGPFNAVQILAGHAEGDDLAAFAVYVGPHAHCAGPPVPAPAGLAQHRRVSVQPAETTIDGCLDWFTVDLFVDAGGEVDAVTFDTWEP